MIGPKSVSAGASRLVDVLISPASYAEGFIAIAYVLAIVGLGLSLGLGLDGDLPTLTVGIGLMFGSFVVLFYCALAVSSTGRRGRRDERA